jgi:inosose dehydratase
METGIKFPMKASVLGPLMAAHELLLISGWFSGLVQSRSIAEEMDAMDEQLATFAALGAKVIVYCEVTGSVQTKRDVPLSRRPTLGRDDWKDLGQRLTEVAERTLKRGVRMAYHHHMGTVVERQEEVDCLMAATGPAVGLLVDSGHITFAGGDPLALIRRHASRVCHVHCKDLRRDVLDRVRNEDMSFLDGVIAGVFTVPGDGFIDFDAFLGELAAIGYRGWLVVEAEQDPAKAHPLTYARMGFDHLVKSVTAAGLTLERSPRHHPAQREDGHG